MFRNGGPHWTKSSLQFCSWVWKPGLQLIESLFLFPDVSGWNNTTFLFLWYPCCKFMWQYYSNIISRSAPTPWNIFLIYWLNNLIILVVFQRWGPLRDPIWVLLWWHTSWCTSSWIFESYNKGLWAFVCPIVSRIYASQVVQDFSHQLYHVLATQICTGFPGHLLYMITYYFIIHNIYIYIHMLSLTSIKRRFFECCSK